MRLVCSLLSLLFVIDVSSGLETTAERRMRSHRRHKQQVKKQPLQSLSELLARSSDLTSQFQKQAAALRAKVQETEAIDAASDDSSDGAASFMEMDSKPLPENAGLKALEAVTEEVMMYTDKMRKLGNEASLFSRR